MADRIARGLEKGPESFWPDVRINEVSVIEAAGDLGLTELRRIRDMVADLIDSDRVQVVVNLKSVTHVDYLSVGLLLAAAKLLRELDGDLRLSAVDGFVCEILKLVGAGEAFERYATVDAAIASFDDEWAGGVEC